MSDDEITLNVEGLGQNQTLSKAENSTQLAERRINTLGVGIKPPYNPDLLASFMERNETLATGIRKKSRYEVGYGFDVVPADGVDPEEADDAQRQVAEAFWFGQDSTWQTGPHRTSEPTTPEEVKELARQDYHAVGWMCLELLVNAEGVPVGLAHVPANTVRVRKPKTGEDDDRATEHDAPKGLEARGYVQVLDGQKRYFGEAGDRYRGLDPVISGGDGDDPPRVSYESDDTDRDPIFVDKETGDVAIGSADQLDNKPANELIFIKNPSQLEQDYGVPDWISATRTITADESAKDYNREFFDNDTIPRMVIKVTGGELSEESKTDLKQMLNGLREESHRAVVLEVEKFATGIDEEVKIDIEPIGQGISEEMDFRLFREKNEHEIAKVLEVPPILIGVTETSNRANSREQVHEFATDVVSPEQHKLGQRIYRTIHQTALGVTDWIVEYVLRGADQPKEEADVARRRIAASQGTMTVDEARAELGMDPLPDGHEVSGDTLLADVGGMGDAPGQPDEPGNGPEGPDAERHAHAPPIENKIGERDYEDVKDQLQVENGVATKQPIEQVTFDSSNLADGIFDFPENELFLSFRREDGPNSLYAYVDVPTSEWQGLVNAGSHGSYHYSEIRLEYPYVEITNFHDRLPEGPMPSEEDIPEGVPS